MKWETILKLWEDGDYQETFPNQDKLTKPYYWRTSPIKNGNSDFKQEFVMTESLIKKKHDLTPFDKDPMNISDRKERNAFMCMNLSKDTLMVTPIPRKGKNYSNLYYFMKEASNKQKTELWRMVALAVKKMLKKHRKVWVSTHGHGVNYLHVRISTSAKYYGESKLK